MQELLEFILKHIVNYPDEVVVSKEEDGEIVRFHITVNPEDAGLVIGKEGKVINAIRNLIRVPAVKEQKKVYLDIVNEKPESATEEE